MIKIHYILPEMSVLLFNMFCSILFLVIFNILYVMLFYWVQDFIVSVTTSDNFRNDNFNTIPDAVKYILNKNKIYNRYSLDVWCNCSGNNRRKLYSDVMKIAPNAWLQVSDPERIVRRTYEAELEGFTHKRVK